MQITDVLADLSIPPYVARRPTLRKSLNSTIPEAPTLSIQEYNRSDQLSRLSPEILGMVGQYLLLDEICQMRLSNKFCCASLEKHFFRDLQVHVTVPELNAFTAKAKDYNFADKITRLVLIEDAIEKDLEGLHARVFPDSSYEDVFRFLDLFAIWDLQRIIHFTGIEAALTNLFTTFRNLNNIRVEVRYDRTRFCGLESFIAQARCSQHGVKLWHMIMRVLHHSGHRLMKEISAKGVSFDMLSDDPSLFKALASELESLSLVMPDSEETVKEPIEEVLNNGNILAMLESAKYLRSLDLRVPPPNGWSDNDHWPSALTLESCMNDKVAPGLRRLRLDSILFSTPLQFTIIFRDHRKLEEVWFGQLTLKNGSWYEALLNLQTYISQISTPERRLNKAAFRKEWYSKGAREFCFWNDIDEPETTSESTLRVENMVLSGEGEIPKSLGGSEDDGLLPYKSWTSKQGFDDISKYDIEPLDRDIESGDKQLIAQYFVSIPYDKTVERCRK